MTSSRRRAGPTGFSGNIKSRYTKDGALHSAKCPSKFERLTTID
jgi:hypothetical protein